jgi:20S proteasome alpha/beta subunit
MTVIVGILCSDGVVIGTDSAMAAGRAQSGYTIERQDGDVLKIEVIENTITAVTGAMGLAQRFNDQIETTIKALRQPFQPPQQFVPGFGFVGSKIQQILAGKMTAGAIPYDLVSPVEIGRIIAEAIIDDFKRTQSAHQVSNGWGLGALFAFVNADRPQLIDFDPIQFHPELKGLPDPERGDQDRIWRCVSWGAGRQLADPFLAHAYRILFGGKVPTVTRAKLVVAWAIKHVSRYNIGLVGGKLQLAVLEKTNGTWTSHHTDAGETEEQVEFLEKYISEFTERQQPDTAAEASRVDVHRVLAGEEPISGTS